MRAVFPGCARGTPAGAAIWSSSSRACPRPRRPPTSGSRSRPGTEGLVALALGSLVATGRGGTPPEAFANVDVTPIAQASGVSETELHRLANLFASAAHPLAIPGGSALGASNGLEAGECHPGAERTARTTSVRPAAFS